MPHPFSLGSPRRGTTHVKGYKYLRIKMTNDGKQFTENRSKFSSEKLTISTVNVVQKITID